MNILDWFKSKNMHHEQDESLVSREELEKFIDGQAELAPYCGFLKQRWLKMVIWWHSRSIEARRKYFLLRKAVVVGGILLPVLSALSMNNTFAPYAPIAIAIVGALVAGCAAWEGVANYGEIWRDKRRSAELLKVEGWQFFQLCGKYKDAKDHQMAFRHFAGEVEDMIAKEVGEYFAVFDSSLAQSKAVAEKILVDVSVDVRKKLHYNTNGIDHEPSTAQLK